MKTCVSCNENIKFMGGSEFPVGMLCKQCLMKLGLEQSTANVARWVESAEKIGNMSIEEITLKVIEVDIMDEEKNNMKVTHKGSRIMINDDLQKFFFTSIDDNKYRHLIHNFDSLIGYEVLMNEESITKGGIGRAVVGGLLFSGVGAIVGGVTANRKTSDIIRKVQVKLEFDNMSRPLEYIDYITQQMKPLSSVSSQYDVLMSDIEKDISLLELILRKVEKSKVINVDSNKNEVASPKERLERIKQLFEEGLLTEIEYQMKKDEIIRNL